jgi:hypothetical protein
MTSQQPNGVHLHRIHVGAICREIGEALQAKLTTNANRLPPHLLRLTERFDRVDREAVAFKAATQIDAR